MRKSIKYLFFGFFSISIIGIAYWHWTRSPVIEVRVQPAELGTVERAVSNMRAGTVNACSRSFPTPGVGGQIDRILVLEGDRVKKGDLLLELWNELHRAEVALAQSQIRESRETARSACLQAESAQREADRLASLQPQGMVSAEQADKVASEAQSRQAQCAAARAAVQVNDGRLAVAEARLNQTRLFAPFDGVVAKVNGDVYQYVTPSPPGIATLPIIDLVGVGCFYVAAPIDEVDAPGITPAMPARITLDAFGDTVFEGRVRRVAPYVQALERQARTVDIEVDFADPAASERLLAGYSADVEVILEARENVIRIPTEAIIGGNRVLVLEQRAVDNGPDFLSADLVRRIPLPRGMKSRLDEGTGVLRERRIATGISNWYHTEVISGLAPGELIVTSVDRPGLADGVLGRSDPPPG